LAEKVLKEAKQIMGNTGNSYCTDDRVFYPSLTAFFEANENSKTFFTDFISKVRDNSYAVIGSVAKKVYVKDGRMTKDIDILTTDTYEQNIKDVFTAIGAEEKAIHNKQFSYSRTGCDVVIDLLVAQAEEDPEESCVEDTSKIELYGLNVRIAKPQYLVWMLLRSDQNRHHDDAKDILNNTDLTMRDLVDMMEYAQDFDSADMLLSLYTGV
jgi:hypothetical protein